VLLFGLAGVACAWWYHAPPLRLSYRGLGELAVALCYGPLIAAGTYVVQRGTVPGWVVLAALPLGLLIAGFLLINELPDVRADASVGKRTLVVRLGTARAARALALLVAVAFAGIVLLPLAGLPGAVWAGLAGLPPAAAAARRARRDHDRTARLIPAQRWMLLSFVLCALGLAAGLLLG
jgi:1,4-dihydroxy-2-naphthoate octaprenyltransferase